MITQLSALMSQFIRIYILFYFNGKVFNTLKGQQCLVLLLPILLYYFEKIKYYHSSPAVIQANHNIKWFLDYFNAKYPLFNLHMNLIQMVVYPLQLSTFPEVTFFSSVYRKPPYIGLTPKANTKYKSKQVSNLFNKVFKIPRIYLIFHKEVKFMANILKMNVFPLVSCNTTLRGF